MAGPDPNARIETALDGLRGRIRRRFLVHGLGWLLAAVALLLLAHFALDRLLDLPTALRVLALVALAVYLGFAIRRRLLYPMSRRLGTDDLALLVERVHPELHQSLISAVQLDAARARGDSPGLITVVQDQAAADIAQIDVGDTLRAERTRRVWAFAGGFAAIWFVVVLLAPQSYGVWVQRLFGSSISYPRETFLTLEIPADQGNYAVTTAEDGSLRVKLARGGELPVNVDAEGTVPKIVELRDARGRRWPMSRRGASHFRHVFRRVLEPLTFYAVGGDDPGTPSVRVEILVPPAITDLNVEVEAPAYTGRETTKREGGLVEALPGSKITLRFRATTPLETASIQLQEAGTKIDASLDETPRENEGSDVETPVWIARFAMPEKTDRYRISLLGLNGLKELSKTLYSLVPTPDRKPSVQLFSPGASLEALTKGASFPLRFVAKDDYGLTRISLKTRIGKEELRDVVVFDSSRASKEDKPGEGTGDGNTGGDRKTGTDAQQEYVHVALSSPAQLLEGSQRELQEGERISLELVSVDNRQPEAQEGRRAQFKIDILDPEELLRRLQSKLRGTRGTVERGLKVQREQRMRLEAFAAQIDDGAIDQSRRRLGLSAAEAGQQRVRGFLSQIRSDLRATLDAHLFNKLDASPAVQDVIREYLAWYKARPRVPASDPGFWAELAKARESGKIGKLDVVGRLGDMFKIAHDLIEGEVNTALRGLASASTADGDDAFRKSIAKVEESQKAIVAGLELLLRKLEDWNDYQDVIRMVRRIRDAERDLMERVRNKR